MNGHRLALIPVMTFTLAEDSALLKPIAVGGIDLANRMFMAPLTRMRAQADGTPSELAPTYYGQRAGAGLIISEATSVSQSAGGAYLNTPGIYTERHQQRWAQVADAVHDGGGRIYAQLWHAGRMAHPDISGVESVGPSAIAADLTAHTPQGRQPLPVPRALTLADIEGVVEDFRRAARRAVDAGLDGVEIHAANGYLFHQFLSDAVNLRVDDYGGSPINRARLAAEVVEAVAEEIGPARVGLRISPGNSAGDMTETDAVSTYELLLCRVSSLGLAYLHILIEPSAPQFAVLRPQWEGTLVLNTPREVATDFAALENLARWGVISAAAIGRAFLANPDLVERLRLGVELNEPDPDTFYAPGPAGYIDYPTLAATSAPSAKA